MSLEIASERLRLWREHPAAMVRDLFDVTPDQWQDDALEAFPHSPRLAMKACTGPGKSAVLAWLGWNFVLTRPHPRVGATSVSGDNLKAGLWAEFGTWRNRCPLLQRTFEMTRTEIFSREHRDTWKIEARTWAKDASPEQIGYALAGLHADYVMWLLDESGGYPAAILPTVEAIFSGSPIEAHIVQAGNPLLRSGPLYRACVLARDLWHVIEITGDPDDPKRSPRISIEHAREQIQQYGRDNPWVLVKIFGQFPPSSFNALIGEEEVLAAQRRSHTAYEIGDAARILGVDVARFGDDQSVIFPRRGIQAFTPFAYRNLDSSQGAAQVSRKWDEYEADAVFVDDTGGYGAGWIDQLRNLGKNPIGIGFAREAHDSQHYANKRAEMAFDAVAWVRRGGALPDCPELLRALTQTEYGFRSGTDKLLLEPKDMVKDKIGHSPDHFDAFILTFAEPITPKALMRPGRKPAVALHDYQPFAEGSGLGSAVHASYDSLRL